jgi:putative membrane protein
VIANYTNHAANQRTFLAWTRTGLAVAAFGFFLAKLNVLLDTVPGGPSSHHPDQRVDAFAAVAGHRIGLIVALVGIAIIVLGGVGYERTRREIDREGLTRMPQSYMAPALSVALSVAASIFCIYLALQ